MDMISGLKSSGRITNERRIMEYNEGVKFLSRAREIELEIREKKYLIDALYTCCGLQGISYDKIPVVTSPENKLEKYIADITEKQKEIEILRQEKRKCIQEISKKISKLETSPEKTVLMGYYVGCEKMKNIAEDIGYEISYCYKLMKRGIKKL